MKRLHYHFAVIFLGWILTLAICPTIQAQSTDKPGSAPPTATMKEFDEIRPLKGLKGVSGIFVVCPDLDKDDFLINTGLTKDAIKTRIELDLRKNGISVGVIGGCPLIVKATYVHAGGDKGNGLYAYNYVLQVVQYVQLPNDPSVPYAATVWEHARVCVTGDQRIGSLDFLDDFLDKFSNDFLTANPKK